MRENFASELGSQSPTVHGLVVSALLIPAAIASCFAGRLADWQGRAKAIAVGASIFALGAGLEAGAIHIAMFVVGRVVEGLGEGLYLGILNVYARVDVGSSSETNVTKIYMRNHTTLTQRKVHISTSAADHLWVCSRIFHMLWHLSYTIELWVEISVCTFGLLIHTLCYLVGTVARPFPALADASRSSVRSPCNLGYPWRQGRR